MKYQAIVLAAGKGTRLNEGNPSPKPKVLYEIGGRPMIESSLELYKKAGVAKPILVVGYRASQVKKLVGKRAAYVLQEEQKGTGHAVKTAMEKIGDSLQGGVFVSMGDMPFWKVGTLRLMKKIFESKRPKMVVATVKFENPNFFAYGRIVRNSEGKIEKNVEQKVASPKQLKIKECNAGLYLFDAGWLKENIKKVKPTLGGEYPLTDLIELSNRQGYDVESVEVEKDEAYGINNPDQLAQASKKKR